MSNNNQNDPLQFQINLILGALIVIAATLSAYFYLQTRHLRQDLNAIRPVATMAVQAYSNEKPGVDAFAAKLTEYGRTHADFAPIVKKFNLVPPTNSVAPAAATKPAVAPTPAPTAAPATGTKK
jgi:hypothetical protein